MAPHSMSGSNEAFKAAWANHIHAHLEAVEEEERRWQAEQRQTVLHHMWNSPDGIQEFTLAWDASPGSTASATSSGSTELSLLALDAVAEDTLRSNSLSRKSGDNRPRAPMPRKMRKDQLDRLHTSTASRARRP